MSTETSATTASNRIETSQFAALTGGHEPPCISLYAPTVAAGKTDVSELVALLRTAKEGLAGTAMTVEKAEEQLRSQWAVVEQDAALHKHARGRALFMAGNFFGCHHLAEPVAERAVIGRVFFVRPLLPVMGASARFFLLAVSQKHAALYEGSRDGIHKLTIEMAPASLHEDLEGQEFERQSQFHSAAPKSTGKRGSVFYGTDINQKERILHFLRTVDRTVARSLKGQSAPLVLAAVEYLFPLYKTANTYPHLLESGVAGNPDILSPDALHATSWKLVESHLEEAKLSALEMYKKLVNTERTSSNLREILVAAERGRVRYLFVPPSGEQWGSLVLPETVHLHIGQEPGDDELLNLAAVLTLRHEGPVYVVPPEELREGAPLAAVFRS
jgi:Bacterial archaeo-eukaryotic release factor family 3